MSKADKEMLSDAALDDLFRAARADAPEPSAALMARIMADADAEIAAQATLLPARTTRRGGGRLRAFLDGLGGWPAIAGMVTATVAGISLGFASPDQLNTLAGGWLLQSDSATTTSYELEDILPGFSALSSYYEEG